MSQRGLDDEAQRRLGNMIASGMNLKGLDDETQRRLGDETSRVLVSCVTEGLMDMREKGATAKTAEATAQKFLEKKEDEIKEAICNIPIIRESEELLDRIQVTLERAAAAIEAAEQAKHEFHDSMNEYEAQIKEFDVLFEKAKESNFLGCLEGFEAFAEECRKIRASMGEDS